jgi:uncharacterized protein with NAD-binding domain and iron-sulfur cluster
VRARPDLPQRVEPEASALVVGGGIAGVSAALVLAERGVKVELLEAAPHLGGRLGTWDRRLSDGSEVVVEHGYHGFFRQYYTLRDILRRLDPDLGFLRDVGGYPIASRPSVGWEPEDFTALPRTPLLNLVALVLREDQHGARGDQFFFNLVAKRVTNHQAVVPPDVIPERLKNDRQALSMCSAFLFVTYEKVRHVGRRFYRAE